MAKLYGSVGGQAKEIRKLYGSVSSINTSYFSAVDMNGVVVAAHEKSPAYIPLDVLATKPYVSIVKPQGNYLMSFSYGASYARTGFLDLNGVLDFLDPLVTYTTNGRAQLSTDLAALTTSDSVNLFNGPVSKEIKKLYGPVDERVLTGLTGTIRPKASGSPNITAFDPSVFLANVSTDTTKTVGSLQLTTASRGGVYVGDLWLWYTNSSYTVLITDASAADLASFGLTVDFTIYGSGFDFVDLTPTYGTVTKAKLIYQA